MQQVNSDHVSATIELAAAYLSNNNVAQSEIGSVITAIHATVGAIINPAPVVEAPVAEKLVPAVSPKKSVTADFIICLEDGKKLKSLKRHLRTAFNLTPEEYRAKWGLATDYPMVAPNYAAKRSELAKAIGLGQGGRKAKAETEVVAPKAPRAKKAKAVAAPVEAVVEATVAE